METNLPVIVQNDPWLNPYADTISRRIHSVKVREAEICQDYHSLSELASAYNYFGLHKTKKEWIFREWAPNATEIFLIGDFCDWQEKNEYALKKGLYGVWEITLDRNSLQHGQLYKLSIHWSQGQADRIPSHAKRVVQNEESKNFNAQIWIPDNAYKWKINNFKPLNRNPVIYEAHIGMATEEYKTGTFQEFRKNVLPRIVKGGYNTIQFMAIQEHPYYGSFGYHVANFFAVSSRFGTPEDLKELIDEAHKKGIAVIMDLVHSHSVKNELEGLGRFDGSSYQYFHDGPRREHIAWDSLCFNYGKIEVLRFLLSNCRFWLDEYKFDGFRFDGITSMLYLDHGLSRDFTEYSFYFDGTQDEEALIYLKLANKLIHEIKPTAITIAEEMSGMPGLAAPIEHGGFGFDYRLAMGVPDYWIKIIKELTDEQWDMGTLFHELTAKRQEEKTIAYSESHDQALVGDKTIIFRLLDKEIYYHMHVHSQSLIIDRGIALHKMIRLVTMATAGGGYLNFMGNEFGHPEWIDFPREGNNWSYKYARRQWSLVDNKELRYAYLAEFDKDMINLILEEKCLDVPGCDLIVSSNSDKVLIFTRGTLLFVFNFNPVQYFSDYGFTVQAGKYQIVLNSDLKKYNGFGQLSENTIYYPQRDEKVYGQSQLKINLPNRVALVFKWIPPTSVY
jgi:1,4-alpha-glucan branching enzyme